MVLVNNSCSGQLWCISDVTHSILSNIQKAHITSRIDVLVAFYNLFLIFCFCKQTNINTVVFEPNKFMGQNPKFAICNLEIKIKSCSKSGSSELSD